jgi:predicted amidohydrolase YtcJ
MSGYRLSLPCLHDHHSHVSLYASFEGLPDIGGLDANAALSLLRSLPGERLSIVRGWRTDRLSLGQDGSWAALERMPPLVLVNASLHGYAFSPSAIPRIAELWPEFAEKATEPLWGERNLPRLFVFYGRLAGLDKAKLTSFMDRMAGLGIGSLEDMTLAGESELALMSSPPFALRISAWATPEVYSGLSPGAREGCAGIKIFLDGSLGARSAALDAPFLGGEEGSLLYSDRALTELLAELSSYRKPLSAHAIGHRAIAQALRCLGELGSAGPGFPSIRLEHAQFISFEQAKRCKELGIVLSMQPNFNSDSTDYADRLIPRHRDENDPFRMLIDKAGFAPGKDLIFGSDGMPHGPEYALGLSLFPSRDSQKLGIEELEAGYGPARGYSGPSSRFLADPASKKVARLGS